MPGSLLWVIDIYGRVYTLSTAGQIWELCRDGRLEFKRVTATEPCCWGIASDHQVYVYVHSSEVPIRYQEETFENQRWNPVDGFCDRLLPSDRWQWSDITGLVHQPLDSFHLPSEHWEWEADWYVDENIDGDPTEKGGWTYAIDFPATYTKDKKWNSCVRRRRWIRYRRYKSRDTWAKVPSQNAGPLPDPFSDLSVGGWDITEEPMGRLSLWAVSLQGKVWYREGICHHNPEGSSWEEVSTPGEVVQISCGPSDLVWAVMWEGQLLVREGISRENPKGSSWVVVESPSSEVGAVHVSVGVSVVWAVTKDRKVWFRRGINSHNPCGTGWIGMVGEMVMLSVGVNDQVWGISCDDRAICFRQGVTSNELSGKTWRVITAARDDRSQASSANSLASAGCFFSGEVQVPTETSIMSDTGSSSEAEAQQDTDGETAKIRIPKVTSDSFISDLVSDKETKLNRRMLEGAIPEEGPPLEQESSKAAGETATNAACRTSRGPQWSNVDLEEAQVGSDATDSSSLSSVATYNFGLEDQYGVDEHPLWAWVCGGGCVVDAHMPLNWFNSTSALATSLQSMSLSITPAQTAVWRKQIFEQLSERTKREVDSFRHYEQAVEQSVWVKKGNMQWWRDWKPNKWIDVQFALEQFSGAEGNRDGILFIYYMFNDEKKYLHAFINEVTILVPVVSDTKHTFAIYTPERTKQRWPIRLAATTEQEMYDWLTLLSLSCNESQGIQGAPSKHAIWSTTCKGDIFVSEPIPSLEASPYPLPCDQMYWRQIGGHLHLVECGGPGIVWGIGYNHTAWVYSGGYGGGFFQGLSSSNVHPQTDVKNVYIYENQRWNPVTGYSSRGLPTDRFMWSDISGLQECTKTNTKPPSPLWIWVSDWSIDYNSPGGTDREGWQYATDFPATYHGHKTIKDFVRRRRWARKSKISTTGPWLEVPPITLWDITIQPCSSSRSPEEHVSVWGISNKGDVLCRLGVTQQTPEGTSWLHVGTDQPFKSISLGSCNQLWAVARDGSAFYRGSVSPHSPAGDCWYHIPSPARQKLLQVSVGRTSVYAVDENGNLWYRHGLTPSYPQGSSWEHISNNVRKVSVGPLDQVWIIADKVQGSHSLSCGTVCHRLGVQPMDPKGQSWDYGIGGGWDHISVRANSQEAPRISLPLASDKSMNPRGEAPAINGRVVGC
ncbi:tectonin beta-propeller repeat-containing protein 1 [Erpetoichthys calabaricus]|uniref:Tectonin beta-propeller repeat-containing protein 1 n=1 Tax=Erpetoichthys calabaricus TaxID=27687 RepID=A0A8C4TG42_ERPCA|nr:tectonin beta-propeller repeat-containing protein 1 [Erpetoichthys calabaricus]